MSSWLSLRCRIADFGSPGPGRPGGRFRGIVPRTCPRETGPQGPNGTGRSERPTGPCAGLGPRRGCAAWRMTDAAGMRAGRRGPRTDGRGGVPTDLLDIMLIIGVTMLCGGGATAGRVVPDARLPRRRLRVSSSPGQAGFSGTGSRSSASEFMQKRWPVGAGPSSNTCPRCDPQRRHRTSVRIMPWEWSSTSSSASATLGS